MSPFHDRNQWCRFQSWDDRVVTVFGGPSVSIRATPSGVSVSTTSSREGRVTRAGLRYWPWEVRSAAPRAAWGSGRVLGQPARPFFGSPFLGSFVSVKQTAR